jgi:transposase
VCRLLMTAPAVGPHIALAFKAGIDDPARFARSLAHRTVGAHFGLTPRRYASGEVDHSGRSGTCATSPPRSCCGASRACGVG